MRKTNLHVEKAGIRKQPPCGKAHAQPSKPHPQAQASKRTDKEKVMEHSESDKEVLCNEGGTQWRTHSQDRGVT